MICFKVDASKKLNDIGNELKKIYILYLKQ